MSCASLLLQACSPPQTGQTVRATILGKRLNENRSVSMPVETVAPVLGQLIDTVLTNDFLS